MVEILNELEMECAFKAAGCRVGVLKLEDWSQHEEKCNWNPENHAKCEGCGAELSKYMRRIGAHNCIEYLNAELKNALERLAALEEKESNQNQGGTATAFAINPEPEPLPLQSIVVEPPTAAPAVADKDPECVPPIAKRARPPPPSKKVDLSPPLEKQRHNAAPPSEYPKLSRPSVPVVRVSKAGPSMESIQLLQEQVRVAQAKAAELMKLPTRNGGAPPALAPVAHSSTSLPRRPLGVLLEPPAGEKEERDCYPLLIAKKGLPDSYPRPMLLPKVKQERSGSSSDDSD
jgi:hypothetical protein